MRRHPRFAGHLDDRQIGQLLRAAPLPDIGQLGLPDQLLDKPGPLGPAERRLMQTHTLLGDDALSTRPPHRTALPHAQAVALVVSEPGRQFDPDVTDAFVEVCSDWPAIARRHA